MQSSDRILAWGGLSRGDADTEARFAGLESALNTERQARIAADANETTEREAADAMETAERIAADQNLQDQIDQIPRFALANSVVENIYVDEGAAFSVNLFGNEEDLLRWEEKTLNFVLLNVDTGARETFPVIISPTNISSLLTQIGLTAAGLLSSQLLMNSRLITAENDLQSAIDGVLVIRDFLHRTLEFNSSNRIYDAQTITNNNIPVKNIERKQVNGDDVLEITFMGTHRPNVQIPFKTNYTEIFIGENQEYRINYDTTSGDLMFAKKNTTGGYNRILYKDDMVSVKYNASGTIERQIGFHALIEEYRKLFETEKLRILQPGSNTSYSEITYNGTILKVETPVSIDNKLQIRSNTAATASLTFDGTDLSSDKPVEAAKFKIKGTSTSSELTFNGTQANISTPVIVKSTLYLQDNAEQAQVDYDSATNLLKINKATEITGASFTVKNGTSTFIKVTDDGAAIGGAAVDAGQRLKVFGNAATTANLVVGTDLIVNEDATLKGNVSVSKRLHANANMILGAASNAVTDAFVVDKGKMILIRDIKPGQPYSMRIQAPGIFEVMKGNNGDSEITMQVKGERVSIGATANVDAAAVLQNSER